MQTANFVQGSPEWRAHREKHFNASDAPAMMGASKYTTRDELMSQLKTGMAKEVDASTQKAFDNGHKFEALARPIAEKIIGEELYPVVGVDGKYSASFDGITMDESIIFEHKTLNDELREVMFEVEGTPSGNLPLMYRIQMEQQLFVSGAKKCLFVASKWNGDDPIDCRSCWHYPDLKLREKIIAGWAQFERDLETFVPAQKTVKVEAEAVKSLPVPSIVAQGALVASNLNEVTPYFDNYLVRVKTELATDQDFADGEANAKHCRESAKSLKNVAKAVIGQIVEINEAVSVLEQYAAKFDAMGLKLEKAVKEQKEQIKTTAIMFAKSEYETHVSALERSSIPLKNRLEYPNFAEAIKGVKTIDSMKSRLNDAVSKGKSEATTLANSVASKLLYINEAIKGYEHLFNVNELAFKDIDFITLSIESTKAAEDKRRAEREENLKAQAAREADLNNYQPKTTVQEVAKAVLPAALEQEFGKQFVEGLDAELNPTRNQLIAAIAFFYKVRDTQAEQWLISKFTRMEDVA